MKTTTAGILASLLVTTAVQAQDTTDDRIAPDVVYQVSPALGYSTDDVLFGHMWARTDILSARDRSLITIAALIASGNVGPLGAHVGIGLDNGLSPLEISETIHQLAYYSGWPNAIAAVYATKETFDARGIAPVEDRDAASIALDPEAEAAREATVAETTAPYAPGLAQFTNDALFGNLWQRAELSPRDRSLVTVAGLIAMGQAEQLGYHLGRAMDNGLTREEAGEVIAHLAFYTGYPKGYSAVPQLRAVFDARDGATDGASATAPSPNYPTDQLTRIPAHDEPMIGPKDRFTGHVEISALFGPEAPSRAGSGLVSFEAGARTAWHSHPLGQSLTVSEGCGLAQIEGQEAVTLLPGDVIWIPPGVKHWHGASSDAGVAHFAIAEAEDGVSTDWMELVSDEEYATASAACG